MLCFTLLAAVLWLHELWLKGSGWRYERHLWASSEGRLGEASDWEETPGRTQDTLERFCLSTHQGTPQCPRRAGGRGKRCERVRWDRRPRELDRAEQVNDEGRGLFRLSELIWLAFYSHSTLSSPDLTSSLKMNQSIINQRVCLIFTVNFVCFNCCDVHCQPSCNVWVRLLVDY